MFGRFAGVVESPVPRRGQVLAWLLATVIAVSALGAASLGINPAAAAQGYIVTADIVDNPTRIDLGKVTPSIEVFNSSLGSLSVDASDLVTKGACRSTHSESGLFCSYPKAGTYAGVQFNITMNNETQTIPITVILVAPAPAPAGWGLAPEPSASASPSHSILYEGGIGGSGKFKYGDTTVNPVLGGPTRQATSFNIAGFPAFAGAKSAVIIRGDALVDIGAAQSIARQQQAILLYNTGAVLDTNVIGYLKTHKDIQTIWLVGELTVSTEGKTALVTDNPTLVVNQVTGANRCETLNQAQKDIRSTEGIVYIDGDAYVDQALVLPLLAGGKTKIALVYPNNICGISPSEEFTAKTIYLVGPDPTAKANINSTNIGRYPRFLGLVAVREKYNRGNRTKTNVTQDIQMDIYRKQNGFVVVQGNNRGGTAEAINSIVYPSQ